MGATFASFQSFGTWPVCNDLLNIISSIDEIWWLNSFRTVGGIVSGPAALWGFRLKFDLLNIISSIDEIWWLNSFRTVGGIVSGPAALWGFRLDRICWIPVADMLMSGMDE